jgi:cytochrome b561
LRRHDNVNRFVHLLTLLAVNAVPAAGWFVVEWSAGTTLAVYWFENVAACLFISARIVIHQRWSPRRGHFRYRAPNAERRGSQASFVQGFLITSLAFCAAHGVFLGVILFVLNHNGDRTLADVDWRSVGFGCVSVVVILAIDFVVDLPGLRQWSFLQIEQTAYRGLGRVVVVHLTLVLGLFAVAITGAPATLFGVFVVLKTLHALSTALPQWEPATAPKWLSRVMNRLPNVHPGQKFEDQWLKDRADEAERRDRNEQPWAGARR